MKTPLYACLLAATAALASAASATKPNIVFILADDLGYADVAFHGGTAPTPNLDKLARESVELTQHYVAATCSPTRSAFLSGRCWSRFDIGGPDNKRAFRWDQVTLPRALKSVGYETGLFGKWHLGSKPEWGPNHFGFDYSYGSLAGGVGPWDHHYKEGEFVQTWHRNEKLITEEGHVTDLILKEALGWLEKRKDAPFFLYVPFTAVHLPLKEPKPWLDKVPAAITDEVSRHYAASIMHLDDAVGQIVAALDRLGKRKDTLLIFTSDNGGSWAENGDQLYPADNYAAGKIPGYNKPWRGQKSDLYDGGIHVAAIASWPGKLAPGKCAQPMQIVDWMPTFCALTGYKPERDLKWDGANMWEQISNPSAPTVSRLLYWTQGANSAIRDGDWKLIMPRAANTKAKKAKARNGSEEKVELFDLANDPYETTNLAAKMPEKVAEMKQKLAAMAKADNDAVAND